MKWPDVLGALKWNGAACGLPELGPYLIGQVEIANCQLLSKPATQADWWPVDVVEERLRFIRETGGLSGWPPTPSGLQCTALLLVAHADEIELFRAIALRAWLRDRFEKRPRDWSGSSLQLLRESIVATNDYLAPRDLSLWTGNMKRALPFSILDGELSFVPTDLEQMMYLAMVDIIGSLTAWRLLEIRFLPAPS